MLLYATLPKQVCIVETSSVLTNCPSVSVLRFSTAEGVFLMQKAIFPIDTCKLVTAFFLLMFDISIITRQASPSHHVYIFRILFFEVYEERCM